MMPLVVYHLSARQFPGALAALAALALVSGCAVGPDFQRPDAPAVNDYTRQPLVAKTASADIAGGEEQRFVQNRDISQQWWTLFQSPQLNALIEKALKANPTIVAAQAALRQANEFVYAQQGFFYPTIAAGYTVERQQLAGNLGGNSPGIQGNGTVISTFMNPGGPAPFNGPVTFNFHTAQLTVGYVPDVFGGNRREVESLSALAESQRFLLEATYLTLTSNLVAAAVQEASLRAQVAATTDIIAISTKSLELLRRQFELGYVARLDVAAQEAALAQVQQTLPPLRKQLEQTRDLLTALAGRFPSDEPEETFELSALHLPQDLPVSLPSKLVEQRPDVRAAEAQLHAASAQVGVAVANRLPQFTITGALGGTAAVFTEMFSPGGPFWNSIGNVTQPIFAGGTLLHRQRAAEEALKQAGAQYQSTVIAAFQNVADTLYALQSDAESLNAAVAAERATKVTLDLVLKQQQLGLVNYLALLSAQQAYKQAVITRVQAQTTRFADTAALFQALGGGWWNRPDDTAAPTATPVSERR